MAVDISQQAYQVIQQVIQKILGDREEAAAYAEDPTGYLAAEGAYDYDLTGVDMGYVMQQAVQNGGAPAHVTQTVQQGYSSGGEGGYTAPPTTPAPGQSPADYLVQHVNYVTYATYEGDDYITQQLTNVENYDVTNIDNSVNLAGNFQGEVAVSVANANATGDGAVAAGGDIFDNQINTGQFTGVQATSSDNAIVGDNAQAIQADGITTNQLAFGSGDLTHVDQSGAHDVALAIGGEASNVSNNEVEAGGALAVGGDASGHEEFTAVNAGDFAVINTEQGEGDLAQQVDVFPGGAPYEGEEEDLSGQF